MGPAKTCCSFPPFLGSNILSVDKSAVHHLNVCSKIIRQAAKTIEMKWRKKTKSLSDYNAIIYHFSGRNPSSPDKFVMETKPGDFFFRWVISVEDTKQSYDLALPFRPARCDVFILWRNVGQLRTSEIVFLNLCGVFFWRKTLNLKGLAQEKGPCHSSPPLQDALPEQHMHQQQRYPSGRQ